jgi:hypothetical protein
MLMLERLETWSPKGAEAILTLRAGALCFEDGRLRPIWCVELMAQAVAASVAYGAIVAEAPREAAGYLVGVEDFSVGDLDGLVPGASLRIISQLDIEVPPAAELTAAIFSGEKEVARARLRMLIGGAPALPAAVQAPRLGGFHGCAFERTTIKIGAGHPYFDGHFPGAPVLPAVGQLRLIEHAASLSLGRPCEFASIARGRFFEPVVPGDELELSLELKDAEIGWVLRRGKRPVSKGSGR